MLDGKALNKYQSVMPTTLKNSIASYENLQSLAGTQSLSSRESEVAVLESVAYRSRSLEKDNSKAKIYTNSAL